MLRDWYSKKDKILESHNKHKRNHLDQTLDNPKANGEYPHMEEELEKYGQEYIDPSTENTLPPEAPEN